MTTAPQATTRGAWMALIAALLGWLFDGAEMGIFSMVGRSAVQDMLLSTGQTVDGDKIAKLFGIIIAVFLVGAATGGVLFGWLGDRIGRVRAMSLSVLTYAFIARRFSLVSAVVQESALETPTGSFGAREYGLSSSSSCGLGMARSPG